MTQEQQKHLKGLLQSVYAVKRSKIPSKYGALPKFPRHIAQAAKMEKKYEKIVQAWKDQQYKTYEKQHERADAARDSVLTIILFGTHEQALAAIKKYERQA